MREPKSNVLLDRSFSATSVDFKCFPFLIELFKFLYHREFLTTLQFIVISAAKILFFFDPLLRQYHTEIIPSLILGSQIKYRTTVCYFLNCVFQGPTIYPNNSETVNQILTINKFSRTNQDFIYEILVYVKARSSDNRLLIIVSSSISKYFLIRYLTVNGNGLAQGINIQYTVLILLAGGVSKSHLPANSRMSTVNIRFLDKNYFSNKFNDGQTASRSTSLLYVVVTNVYELSISLLYKYTIIVGNLRGSTINALATIFAVRFSQGRDTEFGTSICFPKTQSMIPFTYYRGSIFFIGDPQVWKSLNQASQPQMGLPLCRIVLLVWSI